MRARAIRSCREESSGCAFLFAAVVITTPLDQWVDTQELSEPCGRLPSVFDGQHLSCLKQRFDVLHLHVVVIDCAWLFLPVVGCYCMCLVVLGCP